MKRVHYKSLKLHSLYNLLLFGLLLALFFINTSADQWLALVLVILYVAGNGLIHWHKNELKRDTLIEYVLVAFIVLVILLSAR